MTTEQAAAMRQALGELEGTASALAEARATTDELEAAFAFLQYKLRALLRESESDTERG